MNKDSNLESIQVIRLHSTDVLKKPVVIKFWSPVKNCNCEIKVQSVSQSSHWVTFKYKDVLSGKWTSSQCQWNCLADALDDAYNDVRIWSTEAHHD